MADGRVVLNPGAAGSVMDEEELTIAGETRFRSRVVIGGTSASALAKISNGAPAADDYGIVTRNIPSGTQPVSGSVLDSILAAVQDVFGAVDELELTTENISIDAGQINLSTDQLEALTAAIRDRLPALLDADGGLKTHVQNTVLPVSDNGGSLTVDGPVTDTQLRATPVPVSGTVTANAGAGPFPVSDNGGSLTVDGTLGATQSGAWTVTANLGTIDGAATAVKQPALGTAGAASADVITVQGITSMTALKVDGSAVTQPVSGTFFQATQPVSIAGTVTTTGPLTDTQLRATPVPVSGTVATTVAAPATVRNGQKPVAVTNTAVALATTASIAGVVVQALAGNAGNVYVGSSAVTTANGFELQPGQSTGIAIDDIAKVYVNGTSGDGVCWVAS